MENFWIELIGPFLHEAARLRRHRPPKEEQEILHDFDEESRTLRIVFIQPQGRLFGMTWRLCPLCGVTMAEQETEGRLHWLCQICGMVVL